MNSTIKSYYRYYVTFFTKVNKCDDIKIMEKQQ